MNSTKSSPSQSQVMNFGIYRPAVEKRLRMWEKEEFARRFWGKDPTLWFPKPQPEITDRMGWLDLFEPMHDQLKGIFDFAEQVKNDGFRHVVLLGMGGSSLAPEVFQNTFGNEQGYPELIILDSTHPDAVRAVESLVDITRTLFLVSSKSGTTTETLSFFYYFWNKVKEKSNAPGRHFAAITDPTAPLVKLAHDRAFRKVFQAPPDVGGRYSALTVFGLVPAALIGVDSHLLLDRGWDMAGAAASYLPEGDNACLTLGAALGEAALAGRDKVTFSTSPSLASFPSWLEQLIAESTGKNGKGIIPVVGEPVNETWVFRKDRLFVHYVLGAEESREADDALKALENAGHPVVHFHLNDKYDLGQEMFRWEMAVAACGAVLGIHPFDQPDVQLAKELAKQAMEPGPPKGGKVDRGPETVLVENRIIASKAIDTLLSEVRLGDYVAIQAYLPPKPETGEMLQEFRLAIRDRLKLATTLGWGPRFLHSTGQLHKGGPNFVSVIQIVDEPARDLFVPETNYSFGKLVKAQSVGDYKALQQRGRRVLRIQLGADIEAGLEHLLELLG